MAQIWKFPLAQEVEQKILMPWRARILHIAPQNGAPMLWALVEPQMHKVSRTIVMTGTGYDFNPEGVIYLGTVLVHSDMYVWHFFERRTENTPA